MRKNQVTFIATIASVATLLLVMGALWRELPFGMTEGEDEVVTIGMITNNPNGIRNANGFRDGMETLGYIEGINARYLFADTFTPQDALESSIRQMVADGADIIFTAGTPTGVAAHAATADSGVPVVFGVIADPIEAGILTDLRRPGGNMTGVMLSANQARRLELLHNVLPAVRRVLLAYNPDDPAPVSAAAQLDAAAPMLGLRLSHVHVRDDAAVMRLIADLPDGINAVFMLPDSTFNRRIAELVTATNDRRLPISGPSTAQVEAGALMAYGIDHHEVGVQAAQIADRILKGADPALLPVETARFHLTLNTAAARRIGIELSEEILQQADIILREDELDG